MAGSDPSSFFFLPRPGAADGAVDPEQIDLFVDAMIGQGCQINALTAPSIETETGLDAHMLGHIVDVLRAEDRIAFIEEELALRLIDPACPGG